MADAIAGAKIAVIEARKCKSLQEQRITMKYAANRQTVVPPGPAETGASRPAQMPLERGMSGEWIDGLEALTARQCAVLCAPTPNRDEFRGWLAEREGFEPSIRFWRILTFQASAFDHSATAPHALDRKRPLAAASAFRKARMGRFADSRLFYRAMTKNER